LIVKDPIGNPDTKAFEDLLKKRSESHYSLSLYVTGMTPRSTDAIAAIKSICEEFLQGRYDLEVVDIYQHPEQARSAQIIASPTLLKRLPVPLRRLIGDLSNRERVLIGLDLAET
jgi:circadian clock protein KaiB